MIGGAIRKQNISWLMEKFTKYLNLLRMVSMVLKEVHILPSQSMKQVQMNIMIRDQHTQRLQIV